MKIESNVEIRKGSIIVTQINKFGIIFAADSNISDSKKSNKRS